jgi:ribosomal protein S7
MIENFRTEQVSHHMARRSSELEKECNSIVSKLEKVKNGKERKAEDIIRELFENVQNQYQGAEYETEYPLSVFHSDLHGDVARLRRPA